MTRRGESSKKLSGFGQEHVSMIELGFRDRAVASQRSEVARNGQGGCLSIVMFAMDGKIAGVERVRLLVGRVRRVVARRKGHVT